MHIPTTGAWPHRLTRALQSKKEPQREDPQPGYFDWWSEPWTIHAEPTGRVWTPTNPENE
jgi:hypothetical protein